MEVLTQLDSTENQVEGIALQHGEGVRASITRYRGSIQQTLSVIFKLFGVNQLGG